VAEIRFEYPQKEPPRFLTEGHMSMTKSVLARVIMFSCFGLLSCV